MLNVLRQKGVSQKILWFLSIVIILSFVMFGVAYRNDVLNSAGKVYGHNVSLREYEKAFLDAKDSAVIMYQDRWKQANLESEAWTRIVVGKEVKKQNVTINDKELVDYIAQLPFFLTNGRFDQAKYTMTLAYAFERKPKEFEDGTRRTLAIRKLLDLVAGNITFTDAELKAEYVKRNEKIKLAYVLFPPSDFSKDITVSDAEIKEYYNSHKESFKEPPKVNLEYVHLLYPDKADAKQKQAVKDTAVAIAHELTPKADFAAIAAKHGTTLKTSGFFTQDQPLLTFAWDPTFVDKIFAMKVAESSNPMEAPDGWQIVRVKEKKPASVPEFAEIPEKVKDAAMYDKEYAAAKAKAEKTLASIKDELKTKDFAAVIAGLNLKTEETTSFARGEYINAPGLIAEFQQDSYAINEKNKLSGIIQTSQGPAIAYLTSTEKIDEKKYDMDKEDFRQMVTAQKRNERIGTFINKLKLEANIQPDLTGKVVYR